MQETVTDRDALRRQIGRYSGTLLRVAFAYVKNTADAEDIVQDVFLTLFANPPEFADEEHEKAWLIRCTINRSKNVMKSAWLRKRAPLDETLSYLPSEESEVLSAILQLPENYRTTLHLHYYEKYTIEEIASILGRKPATVGTWLTRGRERLRTALEGGPKE